MSELLQSGHHPDADQLNAFVEHALPPHEQEQMLAHLAICPDCRNVVTLSLPSIEEFPGAQLEPAHRPWFAGWNLAWPVAAVLAGLALLLIYIHNAAITRRSAGAPTQMAVSHPPPSSPTAPTSKPSTPGTQSSVSSGRQTGSRPPTAANGAPKVSNPQNPDAVIEDQNIAALPLQGRSLTDLKRRQPMSPPGATNTPLHTSNGSAAGLSMGTRAARLQAPAGNALDHLQQGASNAALANLNNQSATAAPAAAPMMTPNHVETAAAPLPPPAAPARATNQNVAVAAASPVPTLSSMSNRLIEQPESILTQHPLPSQLPALSVVSIGNQTLAIDTQNTLFFSDDGGKRWKAIPSQWQGRAVKVDLTPSAVLFGRRSTSEASSTHLPSNFTVAGGSILSQSQVARSTLTGTVTDATGAVIPNASIVISNAITPNIRSVKTGRDGSYLVDDLVPGSYQVEANAPGFSTQQLAITVAASQQNLTNIALTVGQAAESVTVDASAMSLKTSPLAKKKTSEPPHADIQPLPLFEITTDTGEHWTSIDGQTWKHK
jgi:hypothetical protein